MSDAKLILDKRPTMAEWPVRIWERSEIAAVFDEQVSEWTGQDFAKYQFVYAPKRRTDAHSFSYLFGYGNHTVFYMRESDDHVIVQAEKINRDHITSVTMKRELLHTEMLVHYQENEEEKELYFPYVPAVYYLYDPFLNWMLKLPTNFTPALAERHSPRPQKLYGDSLVMYNYSLGAYRLGNGFSDYSYRSVQQRSKWMPWKKDLEEWLEVSMERGMFRLHTFRYIMECTYGIG